MAKELLYNLKQKFKPFFSMRNIAILLISSILCGCYDTFETPGNENKVPSTNLTLSELAAKYSGEPFVVESDIIVGGWVTSSDKSGNFYRSFTIEEHDAGVEIKAGIYDLWHIYPLGHKIIVNLKGLALTKDRGIIQIGRKAKAYEGYEVVDIGSKVALDKHLYRTSEHLDIQPIVTTTESLSEDMCGRLVRIKNLTFSPEPENVEELTWLGEKRFVDSDGGFIWTYTRSYANFAQEMLPTSEVSLTGILQLTSAGTSTERYTLKLRSEEDCSK